MNSLKFNRQKDLLGFLLLPLPEILSQYVQSGDQVSVFSTKTFHVFETIGSWTMLLEMIALRGSQSHVKK